MRIGDVNSGESKLLHFHLALHPHSFPFFVEYRRVLERFSHGALWVEFLSGVRLLRPHFWRESQQLSLW